jgi:hypothetical protein
MVKRENIDRAANESSLQENQNRIEGVADNS